MKTLRNLVEIGTGHDVTGMQLVEAIEKSINEILRCKKHAEKIEIYVNTKAYYLLLSEINAFCRIGYIKENIDDDDYIGLLCGYPLKRLRYIDEIAPFNGAEYRIVYDDHETLWISSNYDNLFSKRMLNSFYGFAVKAKDLNSLLPNNMIEEEIKPMDYMFLNNNYIKRTNGENAASIIKSYFDIEKVIFNGPATIVVWKDNTKTIVKCEEGTTYSKEEAIDQAILKKLFTTNSHHKRVLKDLINERSVEQIDKKKLKKEHTNYIQEAVANYANGKTEE